MPKLAIYVPKKDWREIEKWRKKINFSKLFMRALAREIRDRSRMVKGGGDKVTAAADFYRRQLADSSGPLVDLGFQLGSEDVLGCRLSPQAIQRMAQMNDGDGISQADIAEIEKAIGDASAQIYACAEQHNYTDQSCPNWREILYPGYVQGVTAAWRKVCDKMNSP